MQSIERVTVSFPAGLSARAHNHGLNVSAVAAKAVLHTVQAIEKETGDASAKTAPAVTPRGATS